jgi:hypothetical protein
MTFRAVRWLLRVSLALVSTCQVRETVAVAPFPPDCDWVFVEGHFGPWGNWHPSHWRCYGYPDQLIMTRP